jgi:hypothetical protein
VSDNVQSERVWRERRRDISPVEDHDADDHDCDCDCIGREHRNGDCLTRLLTSVRETGQARSKWARIAT